jgi:hypothetical protein
VLPEVRIGESEPDDIELVASILKTAGTGAALERWRLGDVLRELPDPASEWIPAGFDVCEEVGYSGLMNCAYTRELREDLARNWATRLNRHHLLDTLEFADEFRKLTDLRVPEHAPFLVHRLYFRRLSIVP